MEAGVPREDLALLAVPLVPVQIIMPVVCNIFRFSVIIKQKELIIFVNNTFCY